MLSERADKGDPPLSAFEQAFTTTYSTKDTQEVARTLEQFAWLTHWIDKRPQPNATELAFAPEFTNASVRALARCGADLARRGDKDAAGMLAELTAIGEQMRGLSPWRGYPITRRVLLGALVKRRVDFGGRFPAELEGAVDEVLLRLFTLHRASAAHRGAVQFFHVSKSGGTNLCQAAEANGCASEGFDTRTNCLIRPFSDQPRWVTYSAHKYLQHRMSSRQALPWFVNFHTFRPEISCEQRRAYLQRLNLTFYANEYANPPGGTQAPSTLCADFVNLIMFRHPAERLRSQIGWVQKLYKEFYAEVDTQAAFVNRTTGFWERLMPAGVNNYYIRSLLGQRFFEFPVNQVAPEHLSAARLAAASHDLLLVLEAKARNEAALRRGLGWGRALRDGAVRSSSELGEQVALPLDWDALLERNAPDVEVYGFAREMQALDSLLWAFADVASAQLGGDGDTFGGSDVAGSGTSSSGATGSPNGTVAAASQGCGYVSLGSPEVVAERAERLHSVALPEALLDLDLNGEQGGEDKGAEDGQEVGAGGGSAGPPGVGVGVAGGAGPSNSSADAAPVAGAAATRGQGGAAGTAGGPGNAGAARGSNRNSSSCSSGGGVDNNGGGGAEVSSQCGSAAGFGSGSEPGGLAARSRSLQRGRRLRGAQVW